MRGRIACVWLSVVVAACATGGTEPDDDGGPADAKATDSTKPDVAIDNYVPPYDASTPDTSTNDVTTFKDAGSDVTTIDASCPTCQFQLQYKCLDTSSTSQQPKSDYEIINQGPSAQAYSGLTVRYWFTNDNVATSFTFNCYYAAIGSGNVTGTVYAMDAATSTADHYLELSFSSSAGTLGPDASSGEIQAAFNGTNNFPVMTQTNDYSFDPTKTAFAPSSTVTLYQNGTLVWGTEP